MKTTLSRTTLSRAARSRVTLSRATLALAVAAACAPIHAETGTDADTRSAESMRILIEQGVETGTGDPATTVVHPLATSGSPPADAGDFLRDLVGVNGVRMGGHGIDPMIRGLMQNRLNVQLDDTTVHGACPNRMDPPTSYAAIDGYDRVEVIRGVKTLIHGPGGVGGTVRLSRDTTPFTEDEKLRARGSFGYRANGEHWTAGTDVAAGNPKGYIRGIVNFADADDYEDGNGDEVRASFKERSGSLIAGWTPRPGDRLEFAVDRTTVDDALYAGAGMDAPKSEDQTLRLSYRSQGVPGPFDSIDLRVFDSEVEHVMDNYSLRDNSGMKMRAPSDTAATGARAAGTIRFPAGAELTVGLDLRRDRFEAERYNDSGAMPMLQSILWPDARIDFTGLFAEAEHAVRFGRFKAALRYDRVDSEAARADEKPAMLAPDALYTIYYGTTAEDRTEHLWSALAGLERPLGGATLYANLSSTARAADVTERYMASNAMQPGGRWVGNPDLDAERHNQFEIGLRHNVAGWALDGAVYVDSVDDYILRDRARGQDGVLAADGASIYRNVDARLYGYEIEAARGLGRHWKTRLTLAYTHGSNTGDDRPLAQMPPLEFTAALEYARDQWDLGGRLRAVADQDRVDDDPLTGSGLDVGPTPGFAVLDLYGGYRVNSRIDLRAGVDNVFDRFYREHINRPSLFEPTPQPIAEPGRSAWLKVSARF